MQHLQEFTEWESFLEELEEIKARVDLSSVAKCESLKTRHDIPSHMIDKTYVELLNHCHVTVLLCISVISVVKLQTDILL